MISINSFNIVSQHAIFRVVDTNVGANKQPDEPMICISQVSELEIYFRIDNTPDQKTWPND